MEHVGLFAAEQATAKLSFHVVELNNLLRFMGGREVTRIDSKKAVP